MEAQYATRPQWEGMLARCYRPSSRKYRHYGAQGVAVCVRWRNSYEAFRDDLGARPSPKHTIDRIDVCGNYEPENCRWATPKEQTANRRVCVRGVWVGSEKRPKEEWMGLAGISEGLVRSRLALGWPLADAVSTPFGESRRSRLPEVA